MHSSAMIVLQMLRLSALFGGLAFKAICVAQSVRLSEKKVRQSHLVQDALNTLHRTHSLLLLQGQLVGVAIPATWEFLVSAFGST